MPGFFGDTVQCIYTVNHKKTCHFVFDYNSGFSWSIFILFVRIETGRNTLQSTNELIKFTISP